MKVLLIGDEIALTNQVRDELRGKDVSLKIVNNVRSAERYISNNRPEVIIFGLMSEGNSVNPEDLRKPENYELGHDYKQFDLSSRSLSVTASESAAYFLNKLHLPESLSPSTSRFTVKDGKVALASRSRPSTEVAKKASAARQTLVEAREALDGLASFEEDPETIGNRISAPLSKEVIQTIGHALDAGIASTGSPLLGKEVIGSLKATTALLSDVEGVMSQMEKTATAAIKVAGVLGVLGAAIAAAVWKLKDLIAALGAG